MDTATYHILKSEIIGNTAKAKKLRFGQNIALTNARTFKKIASCREGDEATENAKKSEDFYNVFQNLRHRRVNELRREQRINFLAYGFINGLPYSKIEDPKLVHEEADFDKIERVIFRNIDADVTDPREIKQKFEQWVQEARGTE